MEGFPDFSARNPAWDLAKYLIREFVVAFVSLVTAAFESTMKYPNLHFAKPYDIITLSFFPTGAVRKKRKKRRIGTFVHTRTLASKCKERPSDLQALLPEARDVVRDEVRS